MRVCFVNELGWLIDLISGPAEGQEYVSHRTVKAEFKIIDSNEEDK